MVICCGNHVGLFIKPHGKMTYPPDEVSRVAVAKGVGVKIGLLPSVSPSFRMPPEHPRCFSAICQNSTALEFTHFLTVKVHLTPVNKG